MIKTTLSMLKNSSTSHDTLEDFPYLNKSYLYKSFYEKAFLPIVRSPTLFRISVCKMVELHVVDDFCLFLYTIRQRQTGLGVKYGGLLTDNKI